jgi:DNA-binding response OmpR family regulator
MLTPTRRLLIIDDDPALAALLMKFAMDSGYNALVGTPNIRFESFVLEWQPTVVAIDIMMPGRDGLELLRALSAIGFSGTVIVITGADGVYLRAAHSLAEGDGLRVLGVLQKPFRLSEFRDLLQASI